MTLFDFDELDAAASRAAQPLASALEDQLTVKKGEKIKARDNESFTEVAVFGPHHSCTGALMRELQRFFNVRVKNVHRGDNPRLWKHTIYKKAVPLTQKMFCVCLVKDPAFWIQSLGRAPSEGTFYEILPLGYMANRWGKPELVPVVPRTTSQLFSPVMFDDVMYDDALHIWEATTSSYFDSAHFPPERTAVLRCEDFIFNFGATIRALAERGLPLLTNAPQAFLPLSESAKDNSHPSCTRRCRNELTEYYKDIRNRFKGLTTCQASRIRKINPVLMTSLGYDNETTFTWIRPLHDQSSDSTVGSAEMDA